MYLILQFPRFTNMGHICSHELVFSFVSSMAFSLTPVTFNAEALTNQIEGAGQICSACFLTVNVLKIPTEIVHALESSSVNQNHATLKRLSLIFNPLSSVHFSRSVVSDSLRSHELQYARPPCPSPTPSVHSNSCPLSWWCHPAIPSSVIPFPSCPQSLLASASFPISQLFAWSGQSIGVSALASVLPKNTHDWSPLEWTGWTSLQSLKSLLQHHSSNT